MRRPCLMAFLFVLVGLRLQAETLEERLGRDKVLRILSEVSKYKADELSDLLDRRVVVSKDLLQAVTPLVLATKAPTKQDPSNWLAQGFGRFLKDFAEYVSGLDERSPEDWSGGSSGRSLSTSSSVPALICEAAPRRPLDSSENFRWRVAYSGANDDHGPSLGKEQATDKILVLQDHSSLGPEIRLTPEVLSGFLVTQAARCGELPCSVPPCCGDECDPCP